MLSLLVLAMAAPQTSDVVLSRTEAGQMSADQLAALVLAEFPHDEITGIQFPDASPGPAGLAGDPSLRHVAFQEQGSAGSGRMCRARRIVATFDVPEGAASKPLGERSADDPRRLFRVYGLPQVAILDDDATDEACASLPADRYASLSGSPEHEGRLRQFLDLTLDLTDASGEARGFPVDIECGDWTRAEEQPCDADDALAKVDWARLSSVRAVDWPHGVSATRITFSQPDGPLIHAYLSGAGTISAAKITYAWPAPF